ncbi:hypothetical protein Poly30_16060 [Planctomycetes bacterium Poly30]|uniref:HEAT repeat protein n=1 Tax=Saltatorellus ferox TaxID=2528018 RepID=A0A518EPT5_9BACT|nr:hypothetical protein Poly30_16060 [Planctomycetes bacterium Poly30]
MNALSHLLLALSPILALHGEASATGFSGGNLALSMGELTSGPRASGRGIEWAETFDGALESAATDGKVVFIAVNMDGESANERMLKAVYGDKRIIELSEGSVNLIASADEHKASGTCPRFGCSSCKQHQSVDISVREKILKPDVSGAVVAPQHVFLAPDGSVILSVPYEIHADELEWCFLTAFASLDKDAGARKVTRGQRPRRVIMGGVIDLGGGLAPITREEALELIADHKKGSKKKDAMATLRRLVTADEPEAREYVLAMLRAGGAGGGGRGGGSAEGPREELLRWIGVVSPTSYWEVCAEFADSGTEAAQLEALVALEQLSARESLPMLMKALRRASTDTHEQCVLRAIGASAREDKKARTALLRASIDPKSPGVRANALLALGWLDRADEVDERLRQAALPVMHGEKSKVAAKDVTGHERLGAVVAMGLTRGERWRDLLQGISEDAEEPEPLRDAARASLEVIGGAPYAKLSAALAEAGGDEIPRDRLFRAAPRRRRE